MRRHRSHRTRLTVRAGAIALTALIALSSPAAAEVVLIGDSLSRSAYKPAGWTVDARNRRSMQESRVNITSGAARLPHALVVALGSNDVAIRSRSMEQDISFTQTQTVGCLVLTTVKVNGVTPFYNRRWQAWARRWNRAIWRSGAVVADWNGRARSHPEWFREDGLHLTTSGAHAYGRLLGQAVSNGC